MATSNFSYPHAVLGNSDDVVGAPRCDVSTTITAKDVVVTVRQLSADNSTLESLISDRSATWVLRLHCARTYFRRAWELVGPEPTVTVPTSDLDGRVEVETFVAARQQLASYSPAGLNDDYEGRQFTVAAGGVLALGPTFEFNVDPDFDPLKAPVSSFLRVVQGEADKGAFIVVWESADLLLIKLSRQDWQQYQHLKQDRFAAILHSSLVLPVLTEAIAKRLVDPDLQDLLWAQRLQAILNSRNISVSDPLIAAQTLLGQPLERAFAATLRELSAMD